MRTSQNVPVPTDEPISTSRNVSVPTYQSISVPTSGHAGDATNALRYITNAHNDEPLFVLRGRDILAVPVIHAYMQEADHHGLCLMVDQVEAHCSRFVQWRNHHPHLLKLPDPHPGWQK